MKHSIHAVHDAGQDQCETTLEFTAFWESADPEAGVYSGWVVEDLPTECPTCGHIFTGDEFEKNESAATAAMYDHDRDIEDYKRTGGE